MIDALLDSDPAATENCRQLWVNVILRAFDDAFIKGPTDVALKSQKDKARNEAIAFLTQPNTGLTFICELAGYEPQRIRKMARAKLKAIQAEAAQAASGQPKGGGGSKTFDNRLGPAGGAALVIEAK